MPANPADEVYNDGSIPHGSAVLTVGNVQYDTDDFEEPQAKVTVVKRKKSSGAKGGSFGLDDFLEGSCTVQIPTVDTADIAQGDTFTTDQTGAKVWQVTDISKSHPKENYKVQKISFIEKLN